MQVKFNAFRGYEVLALSAALEATGGADLEFTHVMVADSYASTHLGYPGTRMRTRPESDLYSRILLSNCVDLRTTLDQVWNIGRRPSVMFDMPASSTEYVDEAMAFVARAIDCGADCLKVEAFSEQQFSIIAECTDAGIDAYAHLGYTPQVGGRKFTGDSERSAKSLIVDVAEALRCGAKGIILEGIPTSLANAISASLGVPVYAIFCGQAKGCRVSVNAWDAVYKPRFRASHFPPSAEYDAPNSPVYKGFKGTQEAYVRLLNSITNGTYPSGTRGILTDKEATAFVEQGLSDEHSKEKE